jgi:uncharacterized protein (TIGR03086 family)
MSEVSERYARLSSGFADKIAAVPADRWESPSPCEGWTARDIVRHSVGNMGTFLGFVHEAAGEGPTVDDDPLGAWNSARRPVQKILDDPARAGTEFDGFFGRTTFESAVDRFVNMDLVVHSWDLARATGLDEHLDPSDVERVAKQSVEFGAMLRSPGVCGPEVEAPADADAQTKLLAFLGRRA